MERCNFVQTKAPFCCLLIYSRIIEICLYLNEVFFSQELYGLNDKL